VAAPGAHLGMWSSKCGWRILWFCAATLAWRVGTRDFLSFCPRFPAGRIVIFRGQGRIMCTRTPRFASAHKTVSWRDLKRKEFGWTLTTLARLIAARSALISRSSPPNRVHTQSQYWTSSSSFPSPEGLSISSSYQVIDWTFQFSVTWSN